MSTIKTNNIQHVDATSANIALDSSGNVTLAKNLTVDTNTLFVDATNNRVGIGTASPSDANSNADGLVIKKTASGAGITIFSDTDQYGNIYFGDDPSTPHRGRLRYNHSSDSLEFSTAATERFRCDSSGRLLVGTSSALTGSNSQFSKIVGVGNSANNGAGYFSFAAGSARSSGEDIANLWFTDNGAGEYASIRVFADGATGSGDYPGRLVFSTTADSASSPTERMRIHSNGDITLGTSTVAPQTGQGLKYKHNNGDRPEVFLTLNSSTNSDGSLYIYSLAASAYRFYVGMGGTVYATNTTISGISDARFKENVSDIDAGLAEVLSLKPRTFDWKPGKGKDVKGDRGFIAQEFEQVFPDLVDEWRDPAPEGEEPYKSVRQDLIPVLVKAIQEQQVMIAELQAEVAALKSA